MDQRANGRHFRDVVVNAFERIFDVREEFIVEVQARRRALGNIQFIGQLFKKKMLTEKIMHSCLMQLLSEVRISCAHAWLLNAFSVLFTYCSWGGNAVSL